MGVTYGRTLLPNLGSRAATAWGPRKTVLKSLAINQRLPKTRGTVLEKLIPGLPGPSESTSRCLSEENEHTNLKGYVHPYVHCGVTPDGEASWVSITGACTQVGSIHKTGRYAVIRKNGTLPFGPPGCRTE